MRRTSLAALGLLVALVAGSCSSGKDWPAALDRYYPTTIDGARVDSTYQFPKSLADSLAAPKVATTSARSVGDPTGDDPLPDLVLLAFRGPKPAVEQTRDDLYSDLVGSGPKEVVKLEGVGVRSIDFVQGDRKVAFADANPRPDVLLVAFSFNGDRAEAQAALEAMLQASDS